MIFFGNNLRVLRTRNGYTQEDMERILGIGSKTWSHYENSKSQPNIEVLAQISNFFGVTLDQLIMEKLEEDIASSQKKPKPYPMNQKSSKVKEPGLGYLLKEVRQIRKDLDSIMNTKSGTGSE